MSILLDVRLKRATKVYHEGETISGVVVISSPSDLRHDGITLILDGTVSLQLSAKTIGIFEAFYNSVKPVTLTTCLLEVAAPGKLPAGQTDIPFEVPLVARGSRPLYETYYGVFESNCQRATAKPVQFVISPESLQNVKERSRIPQFKVTGRLDSTECCINRPFTGELIVHHSEVPIKSVELQLVRVETCGCAEGYSRDATEVQNIQIGEGDIPSGLAIPIYMVFPRLFTCPTLTTSSFKVEFEVNIVVVFQDDHLITENFPIVLTRA
ncbi:hypothetical protein B566_EDAN008069 [Ephemera danica]|nr:hypothetical protein B566_EDAN008069 [Ephemera danica]